MFTKVYFDSTLKGEKLHYYIGIQDKLEREETVKALSN